MFRSQKETHHHHDQGDNANGHDCVNDVIAGDGDGDEELCKAERINAGALSTAVV